MQRITLTNTTATSVAYSGALKRATVLIAVDPAPTNLGTGVVKVLYLDGLGAWQTYAGVGGAFLGLKAGESMTFDIVDTSIGVQLSGANASPSVPINVGVGEG